jgi:hypothetical protein
MLHGQGATQAADKYKNGAEVACFRASEFKVYSLFVVVKAADGCSALV